MFWTGDAVAVANDLAAGMAKVGVRYAALRDERVVCGEVNRVRKRAEVSRAAMIAKRLRLEFLSPAKASL